MDINLIKRLAADAGLTDPDLPAWVIPHGNAKVELCKFAELIAWECAHVSPNEMNITANQMPHAVWQTFQKVILAKFSPY